MSIKVMAVGNILMEDDGVGVVVAKKLMSEFLDLGIGVIIGETDIDYCVSEIKEDDLVFIIDAAYMGNKAGEVSIFSIKNYKSDKKSYSQHSYSLVDLIKLYYKSIQCYIICVEVSSVSFNFGLSPILEDRIDIISQEVLKKIKEKIF